MMDHGGPDRLPPQNKEAEQCVLGSMLRDNPVIGDVLQIIRPDNFYLDAHQKICQAIITLYDRGSPVDLMLLADELNNRKQIEEIGGYSYLGQLWEAAPTAANAEYYARIVRDKAIVRHLIHSSNEVLRDAYDQAMPADELLESAERKILDIAEMGITGQTFTLAQALTEAYDRIDTRQQNDQTSISGLPTGFIDLDEKTAGLQNSELIIMAARPSHGKTALAMNVARYVAVEDNQPVFVVSLEQSRIELAESAGLKLDRGVAVNEHLETSVPGIFAAGDIARWPDPHTGDNLRIEHWVVAERQGQTVARNILGQRQRFSEAPFFWSQHYDVPINYIGHAERWDDLDIEGNIEARDCLVRYRRNGKVLAVASIFRDIDNLKVEAAMEHAAGVERPGREPAARRS